MNTYLVSLSSLFLFQDPTQAGGSLIPSIVFSGLLSGIVGASVTLLGVWLQNRANLNRQNAQLAADKEQRRVEREMSLKRDIYLVGAEALGKMQSYLLSFANPFEDINERIKIISGLNEALNKVAVIASLDMLLILEAIHEHYSKRALELGQKVQRFLELDREVKTNFSSVERIREDTNEMRERFRVYGGQGADGNLPSRIEDSTQMIDALQRNIRDRLRDQGKLQAELTLETAEASIVFESLAADLNYLVRVELGFDIDEAGYKQLIRDSGERSRQRLTEYQSTVSNRINELLMDADPIS